MQEKDTNVAPITIGGIASVLAVAVTITAGLLFIIHKASS